jgi:hypothetical protein
MLTFRISLGGHEAISHHPAHTFTDGSSQCKLTSVMIIKIYFCWWMEWNSFWQKKKEVEG